MKFMRHTRDYVKNELEFIFFFRWLDRATHTLCERAYIITQCCAQASEQARAINTHPHRNTREHAEIARRRDGYLSMMINPIEISSSFITRTYGHLITHARHSQGAHNNNNNAERKITHARNAVTRTMEESV